MRGVTRLLATVVGVVSAMTVIVAIVAALAAAAGLADDGEDCECRPIGRRQAVAVVDATVAGGSRDYLWLDIEAVVRGEAADRVVARNLGGRLSPWRRYRVWLMNIDGRRPREVVADVPPQSLGLVRPTSLEALSAMPLSSRLGLASLLPLFASAWVLFRTRARRQQPPDAAADAGGDSVNA